MSMTEVEEAIAVIEHSRSTHVAWIDWIKGGGICGMTSCRLTPEEHTEIAGGIEHHETAVAGYDKVLKVLRALVVDKDGLFYRESHWVDVGATSHE